MDSKTQNILETPTESKPDFIDENGIIKVDSSGFLSDVFGFLDKKKQNQAQNIKDSIDLDNESSKSIESLSGSNPGKNDYSYEKKV